jgi:hypothetical protein
MSDAKVLTPTVSPKKTLITLAAAIAKLKELDPNLAAEYDISMFSTGITQIQVTLFLLPKPKTARVVTIK